MPTASAVLSAPEASDKTLCNPTKLPPTAHGRVEPVASAATANAYSRPLCDGRDGPLCGHLIMIGEAMPHNCLVWDT
jgi:hypothetical protein